ncbi:MAG: ABC transporter permease [Bryobacterales bacterium]|nr:ABC transporter permease [Bryobacterales bacterium]
MSIPDIFRRRKREQDLDDELRSHLAMAIRDRVERGEPPREAEYAARKELGNFVLIGEATREAWGWQWLEDALRDARHAWRTMGRSPGVTLAAVSSLALGIGANTAIFSLLYTVMLRSLPVARPEELVELLQKYPGEPRGNGYWSQRSLEHYREHNHVFSALTGTAIDNAVRLEVEGEEAQTAVGEYVVEDYFPVLGLRPGLGRLLGPGDQPDSAVAVISWALWNSRFRRDAGVVGKTLTAAGRRMTIVGVAPKAYTGLRVNTQTDLWMPVRPKAGLALLARLKPGVTIEQARAEMALLFRFTIEERAEGSKDSQIRHLRVELEPAAAGFSGVRDRAGSVLVLLMWTVAVLLALACINVAGLLLARGAARTREMALRMGLGASRWRLLRQMLTESLVLSLMGTTAGAAVAYGGTALLLRIMDSGREHEQLHLEVRPDGTLLLFCAGVALCSALLCGLAPAAATLRAAPASPLRQSGRATGTLRRWFGHGLVSAQVALSIVLLSAGVLFLSHVWSLKTAHLGFRRDHVLLAAVDSSRSGLSGERLAALYRGMLERLETTPGVRSAALGGPTPLQGAGASGLAVVEGFAERAEDRRWTQIAYVSPRYFATLDIPLLAGRDFAFGDVGMNPRPAIVSRAFARHYFGNRDAVGKRVMLENVTLTRTPATYEIIGVVGDANYYEIREPQSRIVYLPAFRSTGVVAGAFLVRTAAAPQDLMGEVRRMVKESSYALEVRRMITLSDQIDASIVLERMMGTLAGFFAALGALLAGIGVFGLLAYGVSRRMGEIGIRMALGATRGVIVRMVMRESLAVVAAGIALGVPLVIWGRRIAGSLLKDMSVNAGELLAWGVAAIVAVAAVAAYAPARRAASVDPMQSLRHE